MAQNGLGDIRVSVASDGSVAELCLPERFDAQTSTKELIISLLQQAGVLISDEVCAAVEKAIADAVPGMASRVVVATVKKPVHGVDGWIEWLLDEFVEEPAADTGQEDEEGEPAESSDLCQGTSHYNRSSFVMVEAGTAIARVHPPTLGEDGHDVCGKIRAARQGKPAALVHDETISVNSSGIVIAEVNGAVTRSGHALSIRNLLAIDGSVDFSTGNIEFDGGVRIRKEIKDLFVVQCTGMLEVAGLIEAAKLSCGGDLIAQGGMAGRGRGSVACGGNAHGRYFDGASLEIKGNLSFERELINCVTRVHGSIDSLRGSIIGGELTVAGSIRVANLGSRGGAKTRILLGTVPELEERLAELDALVCEVIEQNQSHNKELQLLSEPGRRLTPDQIERQTELIFYTQNAIMHLDKLEKAKQAVCGRIAELSCIDVRVERMLCHGVRIVAGDYEYWITREARGPLRIVRGSDGILMFQVGSGGRPRLLSELGEVRLLNAAEA